MCGCWLSQCGWVGCPKVGAFVDANVGWLVFYYYIMSMLVSGLVNANLSMLVDPMRLLVILMVKIIIKLN